MPVLLPVFALLAGCSPTALSAPHNDPASYPNAPVYPLAIMAVQDTFRSFDWFAAADIPIPSRWSEVSNVMLLVGTDVGTGCLMADEFHARFDPANGELSVTLLPVNYLCDTSPGAKAFEIIIPGGETVTSVSFEGVPVPAISDEKVALLYENTSSGIEPALESLPMDYGIEDAKADGVVVRIYGDTYNGAHWDEFVDAIKAGIPASVRVGSVTTEGDLILYDYEFDGEWLFITIDTRRDNFAAPADRIITTWQESVDSVVDITEIG